MLLKIFLDMCCYNRPYDVSNFELADACMKCLTEQFGEVGAEAFIAMILREKLDQAKWRRAFYDKMQPGEFHQEAEPLVLTAGILTLSAMLLQFAEASKAEYSGTCGENITWEIKDGVLTLTGSGETKNYAEGTAAWMLNADEYGTVRKIAVGDGGADKRISTPLMKKKRLGLIHKACVVVPKALTEQTAREWRDIFPDAKILTVSEMDLSAPAKRETFTARLRTAIRAAQRTAVPAYGGKVNIGPVSQREFVSSENKQELYWSKFVMCKNECRKNRIAEVNRKSPA